MKLVFIGGGSGLADVLPAFAARSEYEITAIIATFDSGGSSGQLREKLRIPAVGDLRKAMTATAPRGARELLETRLPSGHAVGNLVLTFLTKKTGLAIAAHDFAALAGARVRVVPVSTDFAKVVGHTADGRQLVGEHLFDHPPRAFANAKITRLALAPAPRLHPPIADFLTTADLLIVGPGSLFGSLLVHFAVPGFAKAFAKSTAKKILIAPGAHEFGARGETAAKLAARFPVVFDAVLPALAAGRWTGVQLWRVIQKQFA